MGEHVRARGRSIIVLTLVSLLSGCVSTSHAPDTGTPTSTRPSSPTAHSEATSEAVATAAIERLVENFIAADNHATKTGDFQARDALTSPSCAWCEKKKAYIQKIYSGGGTITGELFTRNQISVSGPDSGRYNAMVTTVVSAYTEVDGQGAAIDSHGDRNGRLSLEYARVGSDWMIVDATWSPEA